MQKIVVFIQKTQWFLLGFLAIFTSSSQELVEGNDIKLYYHSANNLIQGLLPYSDFPLEYPPFALFSIVLPELINWGNFSGYRILFIAENILFSLIGGWIILHLIRRLELQSLSILKLKFYVSYLLILAPFVLWRYDLVPALLTLIALLLAISNFPLWVGVAIGLGITAKLYPVIFIPIFSLYYLVKREYSAWFKFLIAVIATVLIVCLPFIFSAPKQFFSFLEYHQFRGLQLESLASGIILFVSKFSSIEVKAKFNYGAFHLQSSLADSVLNSSALTYLFLLLFTWSIIRCWQDFRHDQLTSGTVCDRSLIKYLVLTILIFIITNKVFSPQYLIWLVPLIPLLHLRYQKLFGWICLLTITIYSFIYKELIYKGIAAILLLNLRNGLILLTIVWLLTTHSRNRRQERMQGMQGRKTPNFSLHQFNIDSRCLGHDLIRLIPKLNQKS